MKDPKEEQCGILLISLILGHPPYLILMYMILILYSIFVCVLYDSEINTNKYKYKQTNSTSNLLYNYKMVI